MISLIRNGWSDLRAHKWRAALTALSLVLGVLSVVAIVASGTVVAQALVAASEQTNGRRSTFSVELTTGPVTIRSLELLASSAKPLESTGGAVVAVLTTASLIGIAGADSDAQAPMQARPVTFVSGDVTAIRRMPVISGAALVAANSVAPQLMLNEEAAREWGGVGTALWVSVGTGDQRTRATVEGVIADGAPSAMIYALAPAFLAQEPSLANAKVTLYIYHPVLGEAAIEDQAQHLAASADAETVPQSFRRVDQVDAVVASLQPQQQAFSIAALIGLFTAALGILNIGLASIGERARELVIRRALGATRLGIAGQLLIAAVLIALLASAAAAIIAISALTWWLPSQIPASSAMDPAGVPWGAIAVGTLTACVTALLGSAVPAAVASRLDIATALRD